MEGNRRGVVLDRGPVEAIVAVRDALAQFDIDAGGGIGINDRVDLILGHLAAEIRVGPLRPEVE
ncbi:MAG: hypothetical protein IE926_14410 [Micrococcales bacterium]|nr:hypothetical protein [Micrococcales bacterium]